MNCRCLLKDGTETAATARLEDYDDVTETLARSMIYARSIVKRTASHLSVMRGRPPAHVHPLMYNCCSVRMRVLFTDER